VGIPSIKWCGTEGDYNVLVMELLGPSLEDLFNFCSRKFSLKTVLLLADQLVSGSCGGCHMAGIFCGSEFCVSVVIHEINPEWLFFWHFVIPGRPMYLLYTPTYENIRWSCLLISSPLVLFYQSQLVLYRLQHLFPPSRLPIRMKQVIGCMYSGKESNADLQAWGIDHFTPKGKVQIEKQAASKIGLHCVTMWPAECFMLISFSIKTHSGATLVGMANWATTNLQATGESFLLQSKPARLCFLVIIWVENAN